MASEQQQAIGMMEGAFFVPKSDLINWVNFLLELEVTRIEQLGTGAVYCQILDAMFPGKVPMQRVNWRARNEWEFINNYKVLQQSFQKCKVQKHIEIEKLSKSKYQDNLEFIQWMKRYYDLFNKNNEVPYDAKTARKNATVDFGFVEFRNPKKKQMEKLESSLIRAKSKSPYDKVKPRINNRSVTIGKHESKGKMADKYLDKLTQIRNVIRSEKPKDEKGAIGKIMKIMQEIEGELPKVEQQEIFQKKMDTVPSKSMIEEKKKPKVTNTANKKK